MRIFASTNFRRRRRLVIHVEPNSPATARCVREATSSSNSTASLEHMTNLPPSDRRPRRQDHRNRRLSRRE